MPYSSESSRREAERAWNQRNSDGTATQQGPPSFTLEETDLEVNGRTITAIRHRHVYTVEEYEEE